MIEQLNLIGNDYCSKPMSMLYHITCNTIKPCLFNLSSTILSTATFYKDFIATPQHPSSALHWPPVAVSSDTSATRSARRSLHTLGLVAVGPLSRKGRCIPERHRARWSWPAILGPLKDCQDILWQPNRFEGPE